MLAKMEKAIHIIFMNTFIYKLGHIPELGRAELAALCSVSYREINTLGGFAFSNSAISANQTGSLVWAGKILSQQPNQQNTEPEDLLLEVLKQFDEELKAMKSENIKRIGFVLPQELSSFQGEIIRIVKKMGFKGVQIVFGLSKFGFGHYRAIKNWLMLCSAKSEEESTTFFVRLIDMSNQEFWSNLDMRMPQRDMKRGIINLKLARSMVNLAGSQDVWDPFVGQGRVMAATMDTTKTFLASDIDPVCLPEMAENIEYAGKFWQKYGTRITQKPSEKKEVLSDKKSEQELPFSELVDLFALDAAELNSVSHNVSNYALVTEGYLGPTLSADAKVEEAKKYLYEIAELWTTIIPQAIQLGMSSVVFCLPYYSILPFSVYQKILNQFTSIDKVQFVPLSSTGFIVYSREKTRVGHALFQLRLK